MHSTPSGRRDPEEIYNILEGLLVKAMSRYDPYYTQKCKQVADLIHNKYRGEVFDGDQLNRELDFDGTGHCRLLVRHGFLETRADSTYKTD